MVQIKLPKAPPATSEAVRASMCGNRPTNTKPEAILAQAFCNAGLQGFTRNAGNLPGSPDLAFNAEKIAIFVHGCYWHRCPYCSPHFPDTNQVYWSAKFKRNIRRDKRARTFLRAMGWKPLVIWECKLKKDSARMVRRVVKALQAET